MSREALDGIAAPRAPRSWSTCRATSRRWRATRGASSMPATRFEQIRRVRSVPEHAARRDRGCVREIATRDLARADWRLESPNPTAQISRVVRAASRNPSNSGAELAGAPEVLRVPLHAEAEARRGILDRFDDAVGRRGRRRGSRARRPSPPGDAGCSRRRRPDRAAARRISRASSESLSTQTSCASVYGWCGGTARLCARRARRSATGCPAPACRRRRRSAPARRGRSRRSAGRAARAAPIERDLELRRGPASASTTVACAASP